LANMEDVEALALVYESKIEPRLSRNVRATEKILFGVTLRMRNMKS